MSWSGIGSSILPDRISVWRLSCLTLVLLSHFALQAEPKTRFPFRDPPFPTLEESVYQVNDKGKSFLSTHSISRTNQDGQEIYIVRTHAFEMTLIADDLRTLTSKKIDTTGQIEYACDYDYDRGRVHFVYPGPTRNKVKEIPEDSYDANSMVEVLRGYPFATKKDEVKFVLVTTDHVVGVYAKIKGEERIQVPLGEFDCYLIEAGVGGLKGKVYTVKFLFWIEKEYPYRVLKHADSNGERVLTLIEYNVSPNGKDGSEQ